MRHWSAGLTCGPGASENAEASLLLPVQSPCPLPPEPVSSFQPSGTGVSAGHLASSRCAPVRNALVRSALVRSMLRSCAPLRSAPVRRAGSSLMSSAYTTVRCASSGCTLVRLALVRFALGRAVRSKFAPFRYARIRQASERSVGRTSRDGSRRPMTVRAGWTSGRVMRSDAGSSSDLGSGHCSRECSRMNAARTSTTVGWSLGESRATRPNA